MSPSATSVSDSPPPFTASEFSENNLEPFFVLHKGLSRKPERKSPSSLRAKRRIDLSPPLSPNPPAKSKAAQSEGAVECAYERLRSEAFQRTWSKIESTINGVLRGINADLFDEVHHWVCDSFAEIRSIGVPSAAEIVQPYPLIVDGICRQIFTALILTKNIEFVDDLRTFKELGEHLKLKGCHVVNLSQSDFVIKNGIGGCLKSLLGQLVSDASDVADIAVLASWYCKPTNNDKPVVVIIDDMERCQGSVLADFILMLSEWVVKIPMVLIMGVTTTVDAPRRLLPSNALQQLRPCKFMLGSPTERMNAIVEAVLLRPCSRFTVGYKVSLFLRDYFTRHDGTVTSFIKAMKIACMKHFSMEPLSFLGCGIFDEDFQSFSRDVGESLPYATLKYAFDLPSCQREQFAERTVDMLTNGLAELKKLWDCWSSVVLCIYEVAKHSKVQLLDIVCEAHNPSLCNLRATDQYLPMTSTDYSPHNEGFPLLRKVGIISRAVHKVRDLPAVSLSHLLNILEGHTQEMAEVHQKVRELQLALRSEDDGNNIKPAAIDLRKRSIYRSPLNVEKGSKKLNEKASILMEDMIRDYLKPIESAPFHEIICFKHVDVLQSALIGDPRKMIQVDLVKSKNYLQCSCCRSGGVLLASMHDTSLMYSLAREHGDLINLHDWYQSFKAVVSVSSAKNKRKMPKSPSKKTKLAADLAPDTSEATLQARFCRAVTELQITGLLRMPSKRRPDFVQRVAFGI